MVVQLAEEHTLAKYMQPAFSPYLCIDLASSARPQTLCHVLCVCLHAGWQYVSGASLRVAAPGGLGAYGTVRSIFSVELKGLLMHCQDDPANESHSWASPAREACFWWCKCGNTTYAPPRQRQAFPGLPQVLARGGSIIANRTLSVQDQSVKDDIDDVEVRPLRLATLAECKDPPIREEASAVAELDSTGTALFSGACGLRITGCSRSEMSRFIKEVSRSVVGISSVQLAQSCPISCSCIIRYSCRLLLLIHSRFAYNLYR